MAAHSQKQVEQSPNIQYISAIQQMLIYIKSFLHISIHIEFH